MQVRPLWPFFAVERLGLGKRDLFLKNKPALALFQIRFLFFFIYII
jgi:hypothetical protein